MKKISSMLEWPKPTNVKSLRGFLRLMSYYKKFIKNYGVIVAPLIVLLRKMPSSGVRKLLRLSRI